MIPESSSPGPVLAGVRHRPTRGVIARYRDWLPVTDADPVITLGEGSTPLVEAEKPVRPARLLKSGSRSRVPTRPDPSRTAG